MNCVKETDIKNRRYYFLDDMINIKNLDPNKINIDEKSYKNIFIYYIGYMTTKSAKSLYLIINKINRYTEESNGNTNLTQMMKQRHTKNMKNYGRKSKILLDNK